MQPEEPMRLRAEDNTSHLYRIGILLVLAGTVHTWLLVRAEGPARDGVGFIGYALRLERRPWREVLAESHQHPLYPATILAVSVPVRWMMQETSCASMLLSAQLAAAVPGILLVVPMYWLGCMLLDRRVGFWAAALFQSLPVSSHILADTLSDQLCLLLVATALCLAVLALRHGSAWWYAGCGLCSGLAYLARPEGLVAGVAAAIVLLMAQLTRSWRQPWSRFALSAVCLLLGIAVAGGPLVAATGRLSTKPAAQGILHVASAPVDKGTTGPLLAIYWNGTSAGPSLLWSLGALASEVIHACQYWLWIPALGGWCLLRRRICKEPAAGLLLVVCVVHALVLLRLSQVAHYLGVRHVQIIMLCGIFWAMAALVAAGDWLTSRTGWRCTTALLLASIAVCLPGLLRPLHNSHAGYRDAGLWLATHAQPADEILDTQSYVYFYSGRVLLEGREPAATAEHAIYAVVEEPPQQPLPAHMQQRVSQLARQGTAVFRCPLERSRGAIHEVAVYKSVSPAAASGGQTASVQAMSP
jgi:hypothetical protein